MHCIGKKYFNGNVFNNICRKVSNKLEETTQACWKSNQSPSTSSSSLKTSKITPIGGIYTRENLINLTKQSELPEEKFVSDIQKSPLITYSKFYNNQFDSSNNKEVILRIVSDINSRLNSEHFQSEYLEPYKQSLQKIRDDGVNILQHCNNDKFKFANSSDVYSFVLNYIETMYELLKSQDSDIQGTYYTDFAKDFMKDLCVPGKYTQLYFTFQGLDEQYFIDVRPLCLYPVYLMSLPEFTSGKPLIPTRDVKGYVESKLVDFREVSFHDLGHAHVMSRQDKWLFETCNRSPLELVTEWLRNKNWYMDECNKLQETNPALHKAIKIILFDIVHDRGYQFYLPILKQQFKANKNLENLKSRILRGEFDNSCDRNIVDHLDEARRWLIDLTDKFIVRDNLDKIEKFKKTGYVIKKFQDVESCAGVPLGVAISKDGRILVNFDSNGKPKTTSLYEIELITLPVGEAILDDEKISNINKIMSNFNNEFIHLDCDANVLNPSANKDTEAEESTDFSLKRIEIFKLERVLRLIKDKKSVKFSVSKLPGVFESNELLVNEAKGNVTIETGLFFKLNEISIENAPRTSLKYINLEPNHRFVSEKKLRDSYIIYPNTKNPHMKPYVTINDELELGIIDTKKHVDLAKAVSSLLSRSIEKAKDIYGGYLPSPIVERAQREYVSPYAVSHLWGKEGRRFVLTRKVNAATREIIGTALIAHSTDHLFFFTNKYNNIKPSIINEEVDFELSVDGEHKWFDKFAMPKIEDYKPKNCNQLANFAVETINCRGIGLGKLLIDEIVKNYAVNYSKVNTQHSQPLICGEGLFQIADPSWPPYMLKVGFKLRQGAETFYKDEDWSRLPSLIIDGKEIDHKTYNRMHGLPQIYENSNLDLGTNIDLKERIPEVIELANSGDAKLQYFQMTHMFNDRE